MPEPAGETRTESDTFGPIKVPAASYYGAQTARSMYHFNIGLPTGTAANSFPSSVVENSLFRSNSIASDRSIWLLEKSLCHGQRAIWSR